MRRFREITSDVWDYVRAVLFQLSALWAGAFAALATTVYHLTFGTDLDRGATAGIFVLVSLVIAQFLAWRRAYTKRVLSIMVDAVEPYFDGVKVGVRIVNRGMTKRGVARDWELEIQAMDGTVLALHAGHQEGVRINPIAPEDQSFITAYFPGIPERDQQTARFVVIGKDVHDHASRSGVYPFHRSPPWPLIRSIEGPAGT